MQEISSDYNNLFNKYQFDKLGKNINNINNSEIDNLIKNINTYKDSQDNYMKKKSKSIYTTTVFLSDTLLTFFKSNMDSIRYLSISDEMTIKDIENAFHHMYYQISKLKVTDNDLYEKVKNLGYVGRHERKKFINEIINTYTTKIKTTQISL